jgi:hypothetical protein
MRQQPVALGPDGLSVHGRHECQYEGRTWPVHYDFVEPLAIQADIATIVLSSVVAGLLYHYLQDTGTVDYVSKSLGSAILVSALFVSLRKTEGCTSRPNCWSWPIRQGCMLDLDNAIPSARWRHISAEDRKWSLPRRQQPLRNAWVHRLDCTSTPEPNIYSRRWREVWLERVPEDARAEKPLKWASG